MKLEFTVALEEAAGTISIPMQGVKDLALSDVTGRGPTIRFTLKPAGAPEAAHAKFSWDVAEDGTSKGGLLRQMGQEFTVTAKRLAAGEAAPEMRRPQEPKPPFPYLSEEVEIKVGESHVLSGTLTVPEGKGPFPGVILVSGSGPQDRDEALLGHKPFLVLADHLTRSGVAVLRYDDRGVGKSTGNFAKATSDDFGVDALAALEFLSRRPEIDAGKVGIVGHSEGGLIASMVAATSDLPRFIVLLAGPGMRGLELLVLQGRLITEASGADAETAARNAAASERVLRAVVDGKTDDAVRRLLREAVEAELAMNAATKDKPAEERAAMAEQTVQQQAASVLSPWVKRFLAIDPAESLRKVRVPVLAMIGEKDLQVPPKENLEAIRAALSAGGNTKVTLKEMAGLNHLFQTAKTGAPGEYVEIEETFAPAALEAVSGWIREVTGSGGAAEKK
jgi:pimeloyl-ACP methyl ester carboxylesterase